MKKIILINLISFLLAFAIGCSKTNNSNSEINNLPPSEQICQNEVGINYTICINNYNAQQGPFVWSSENIKITDKDKYRDLIYLNGNCSLGFDCKAMDEKLYIYFMASSLSPTSFGEVYIRPLSDLSFLSIGNVYSPILSASHAYVSAYSGEAINFDHNHIQVSIRNPNFVQTSLLIDIKYNGVNIASGHADFCDQFYNCLK